MKKRNNNLDATTKLLRLIPEITALIEYNPDNEQTSFDYLERLFESGMKLMRHRQRITNTNPLNYDQEIALKEAVSEIDLSVESIISCIETTFNYLEVNKE